MTAQPLTVAPNIPTWSGAGGSLAVGNGQVNGSLLVSGPQTPFPSGAGAQLYMSSAPGDGAYLTAYDFGASAPVVLNLTGQEVWFASGPNQEYWSHFHSDNGELEVSAGVTMSGAVTLRPMDTTPDTPGGQWQKLYFKQDGLLYSLNDQGVEAKIGGGITMPLTQSITFSPDNTYDIGATAASRPRNLYVGNGITTPGWTIGGALLAVNDNSVDIGAGGANRPRNLWLAGNFNVAGTGYVGGAVSFNTSINVPTLTVSALERLLEVAKPATPPLGYVNFYPKSDHHLYQLDSTGTETDLTLSGSNSIAVYEAQAVSGATVTLPATPMTNGVIEVAVNGQAVMQTRDWSISGAVITFTPALTADDVHVEYMVASFNYTAYSAHIEQTLSVGQNTLTLPTQPTGTPLVTRGGITQYQSAGQYSISGATVTFTTPIQASEDGRVSVDFVAGGAAFLPLTGGTLSGGLLFNPDNTYDIGAGPTSGRARDIYVGRNLVLGPGSSGAGMPLVHANASTVWLLVEAPASGAYAEFVGRNGAHLSANAYYDGAAGNYKRYDTSNASILIEVNTSGFSFYGAAAAANPITWVGPGGGASASMDAYGNLTLTKIQRYGDAWVQPTLINGWTHYSAPYGPVQYRKMPDGRVVIRGIATGPASLNVAMFNLPAGFRPIERQIFACAYQAGVLRNDIDPSGDVVMGQQVLTGTWATGNWASVNEITFLAEA